MRLAPSRSVAVALLLVAAAPVSPQVRDLEWSDGLSEMPLVDLSGRWRFDPRRSDPLVAEWQEAELECFIYQQPDRIVLQFVPGKLEQRVLDYRWDGTLRSERRESTEVRERARWVDGGRALEIEGRWWLLQEEPVLRRYVHRYRAEGSRALVLTLEDEYGTTVWRFERRS